MSAAQSHAIDRVFNIIADEVRIPRDELDEDEDFTDLGINDLLAKSIICKVSEETRLQLPLTAFTDYSTSNGLRNHLKKSLIFAENNSSTRKPTLSSSTSIQPLSLVLQTTATPPKKTMFLLPDGSGSGMAYSRLPAIDPDVCLVGMNSPFLKSHDKDAFSVEGIAAIWAQEIRKRQQKGPYILGGWSAGGYYSFEVAKILVRDGEKVDKLILIDSPCRAVFEELPMEVVRYLSSNNMMGNWGVGQPPAWMINHFKISIRAISEYEPRPMESSGIPEVFIIWATEGMLEGLDPSETGLDFGVKTTRMLLQRPESDGPLGWNMLFPRARLSVAKMPGNHFSMVHPPHVSQTHSPPHQTS